MMSSDILETSDNDTFPIGRNKNYCLPIEKVFPDDINTPWIQIIFASLYTLVLFCGIVANTVTLCCLLSKSVQIDLNVKFLINLNVSGLLISITSLPITAVQIFYKPWLWGKTLCHFVPLFQGASFFINSFTLVAIAVDRYLIIAQDSNVSSGTSKWNKVVIFVIWLLGLLISIPYAIYMNLAPRCVETSENTELCLCGEFCEESWPDAWMKLGYGISAFFLQFGLPLCILAVCYWRVNRKVAHGVRKRLSKENLSLVGRQRLIKRRQRTAATTVLLVVSFIASWLPVNILNLLRDYDCVPVEVVSIVFAVCHLVAMTSVLWNPIIYCWYNKELLRKFCKLFNVQCVDGGDGNSSEFRSRSVIRAGSTSASSKNLL